MNATSITLQGEASKLRQALTRKPKPVLAVVQSQLAEYMCIEMDILTFSDGSMYCHDVELELNDEIPCWWSLK